MVISNKINVKVNSKTYKRYKNLGYKFNCTGDIIEINYYDLSPCSEEVIDIKCDYCGKIFKRKYGDHFKIHNSNDFNKDACCDCKHLRQKELSIKKYGVSNPFQRDEAKKKIKQSIKEKYGVEYISQSPIVQDKIKENNMRKYGVENTSQLQSVKDRVKETNRSRYGYDYPMQSKEYQKHFEDISLQKYGVRRPTMNTKIKKRVEKTNIKRYGVKNPSMLPQIRKKITETKYKNGSQISSKQQNYICDILGGKLNYPFGRYFIDIAFPNDKIAVEYNGGGHNLSVKLGNITQSKFDRNEIFRKKQLYSDGWKIITFISDKNKVLSENELVKVYNYALHTFQNGRHWIEIYIDENKIVNSQETIEITQVTMND